MKKLRIDRKNKKGFQKFAAGVMALVMTVSGLTISPVRSEAAAAEYEIYPIHRWFNIRKVTMLSKTRSM